MALYVIGDLHLSFSTNKQMDVFGGAWTGYVEKIKKGLSVLRDEDTLVVCGDISWGMSLESALEDFLFLDSFPGKKILLKGNHDYWWSTCSKMNAFFQEHGINSMSFLHNNCFSYGDKALCGTRGWFYEEDAPDGSHNAKVFNRELLRLEASLMAAEKNGVEKRLCFLHYPPIYEGYKCEEIISLMNKYKVKYCYYGHLHGFSHAKAIEGDYQGIHYNLIAGDYLNFIPLKIME